MMNCVNERSENLALAREKVIKLNLREYIELRLI